MRRIQKWQVCFLACGFLVLITLNGLAQPKESDSFKFSMSVLTEVTDNRDSSADKESNIDVYLWPRISKESSPDVTKVKFYYAPSYRYRTNPAEIQNENELMQDVGISIDQNTTPRLNLRLYERFNKTDDPAIHDNRVDRPDSSYMLNRVEGGANYQLADKVSSIDLSANNTLKQYDKSIVARTSDEDSTGGNATYWREVQEDMGFLLNAGLTQYNYENYTGFDRGLRTMFGGVGLEKVVSQELRYGLRAGFTKADYNDNALGSETAPFGEVSFQMYTIPSFRINGGAGFSLRNADVYPFSSQREKHVNAGVEWDTTAKVTCGGGVGYHIGEYDDNSLPPSAFNDPIIAHVAPTIGNRRSGEKKTLVVSASMQYKMTDNSSVKLEHRYEDANSDVDVIYPSFTRNATRLMVVKEF